MAYYARRQSRPKIGSSFTRPAAIPPSPAAPTPPATPTFDAPYYNDVGLADRTRDARLADISDQERKTKFEYGFDDPTNPFSRINELKRMYLNAGTGLTNNLAVAHQSNTGAAQAKKTNLARRQDVDTTRLRASYQDALNRLASARTEANLGREDAGNSAFASWLNRAPAVQPNEVATPAPKSQSGPVVRNNKGHLGRWHTRPDGSKVFVLEK